MLKITLWFTLFLIGVYWIGEKVRRNPKIDRFLLAIEDGYSQINNQLENTAIVEGLRLIKKIYGYISLGFVVVILAIGKIFPSKGILIIYAFWIFFATFMAWLSIGWVLNHKNEVKLFFKNNYFMLLTPIALGLIAYCTNSPIMSLLMEPIYKVASTLHFEIPRITQPLLIGLIICALLMSVFLFQYISIWIISVPLFLLSLLIVAAPINFARAIAGIDRQLTFLWFSIFAAFVIGLCLLLM